MRMSWESGEKDFCLFGPVIIEVIGKTQRIRLIGKVRRYFFFAIMCVHSQKTSANLKSHDGRGREGGVDSSEMARFWRPSTEDLHMGSGFLLHLVL